MIKVMLVDDHELVRIGIRSLLVNVSGIEVVAEATGGEEAIEIAKKNLPDVILMDVKMPGIGGLEATIKILSELPSVKVIAVTACDEDPFPSRLLQAGASGYLTKGSDYQEMIQAIRKVHAGGRYISPIIAQQLAIKHATVPGDATTPFDPLSKREIQVMMMITSGQKVQDIADKLGLSTKTVNTYRYRIFEKLKLSSDVELTHLALRHGMVTKESLEDETRV